jgi:hypothetical protein
MRVHFPQSAFRSKRDYDLKCFFQSNLAGTEQQFSSEHSTKRAWIEFHSNVFGTRVGTRDSTLTMKTDCPSHDTKKRFIKKFLPLIGGGMILVICAFAYVHGIHRVDPKSIELLLDRNLQPGTDKDVVIQFLDSQHIAHSEYVQEVRKIFGGWHRRRMPRVPG